MHLFAFSEFRLLIYSYLTFANLSRTSNRIEPWIIRFHIVVALKNQDPISQLIFVAESLKAVEIEKCRKEIAEIREEIYKAQKKLFDYPAKRSAT